MKNIYVQVIPAYQESEEMVFKYSVYDEDEQLVERNVLYHEYRKPVLASLFGISSILKELRPYRSEEIKLIVNDGALVDALNGRNQTKNRDLLKVAELTRNNVRKFSDTITFEHVGVNHQAKLNWESKLG